MEKQQTKKTRDTPTKRAKAKTEEKKKHIGALPTYTNPVLMAYRIGKYFYMMDNLEWENSTGKHTGKPYTDTGIDMALGTDRSTSSDMTNGTLDHIVTEILDGVTLVSKTGVQNKSIKDIEPEILPYVLYLLGNSDYAFDKQPLNLELEDLKALDKWGKTIIFSDIMKKAKQTVANQREYRVYDRGLSADIFAVKARDGWQDETVVTTKRELATSSEAQNLLDEYMKTRGYMLE